MLVCKIRAWLRFFRAHTAILEAPIAVLGASLAFGTIWDIQVLYWLLFGVLYHFVGYGMNSYTDWVNGFDKDDPHKEHHPLNTGEISPTSAKYAVLFSLIALIVYGVSLAGVNIITGLCVLIMLIAGTAYNVIGKYTEHKYIFASIVHTMVFVFPYLSYTTDITTSFILGAAMFFIHHVFQIAVSGDVKDIDQDESSLLKDSGCRLVTNGANIQKLIVPSHVYGISMSVVVGEFFLAVYNATSIGIELSSLLFTLTLGVWMIVEANDVIKLGLFDRDERISAMSRKELAGIWMICASFIPVITVYGFYLIVALSSIYLFIMSKFMWDSWIKPEV